ncbi:MAG: branched-chain amino acid ABC transporter permease [Hyphomicrobiaceae bacterium]
MQDQETAIIEDAKPAPKPVTGDNYGIDWRLTIAVVAVVAVLLVVSPPLVVFAIIEIMIFALYASALNLLLSYSGMVSFGHAAYFGLGAYGLAIFIAKFGFSIPAGILIGPLVAAFFGLIYGALAVQLTAIYAAMVTLACAEITFAVVFQWFDFTGGDSGITGHVPAMLGLAPYQFGLIVLFVVTAAILALWRIIHSPLGLTIRAVGENSLRAGALGHGRKQVQLIAFVISGFFSGIAGTLFGVFHGNVFPDYVGVLITVDGLVMVILGGLYSFGAGIYGAIVYKLLDNLIAHYFQYWQLVVGIILILVVIASPSGIAGLVERLRGGRK